ncbi:hypothetical protein [Bacillus sp. Cr_A10]|uniref:hypothetical protein n=1 Tax=Bacillus sp. Cr_A10 TaxID=3033993 RepID=UPI0023DB7630|nr:hypothetical protein [Bacillus sp. Cr_A10]MDF2065058.1 hypothetical protein [Bacillus sp. Cr_A10]
MELILIKTYKHLSLYEREWKAILKENENINPFIEFDYIYNWWKSSNKDIEIEIHAVKEHNKIIAFFPFQLNKNWFGYKIQFLSLLDMNHSNVIVKRRDMDRVIMFVLDMILKQKKSVIFLLNGLLESEGTPGKISNYLKARNIKEYSIKLKDVEKSTYKRKMLFSTNSLRAKTYRNSLWIKEKLLLKGKENLQI